MLDGKADLIISILFWVALVVICVLCGLVAIEVGA